MREIMIQDMTLVSGVASCGEVVEIATGQKYRGSARAIV